MTSPEELQKNEAENLAEFQPILKLERLKNNIKYSKTTASNENTTFDENSVESLNLSGELEKFKNNDDNDNHDDSVKEEPTEIIPDIFEYNSTPAMSKSNENGDNSEV